MAGKLTTRWSPNLVQSGLALLRGCDGDGPFGKSIDGFVDLRGLPIKEVIRPDGVVLKRIDFTEMQARQGLIFANSKLELCRFDGCQVDWGDYASMFQDVSFIKGKMAGSGFGGNGSVYHRCDFTNADISGSTGIKPTFTNCIFDHTNFKNSIIRDCTFIDCKFIGKVDSVIFGGEFGTMITCDLTEASFIDCTFNNFRFENCFTSDRTLIFQDWEAALKVFAKQLDQESISEIVQTGRKWLGVWNERLNITPSNLVDLADLIHLEGSNIGPELFRIYVMCQK